MKIYVGTSGFSYREWKGKFYPARIKVGEMLRFYAERFGAVEVNNTFYRLPEAAVFEKWIGEVPSDFKFALKAQNQITHIRRLRPARREVSALLKLSNALGSRVGPILFQLPPNFKKDAARLKAFLKALPESHRYAFEFRNESWFDDEVFGLLRERKVALCVAESEETPKTPLVATTDWGYLRLRRLDYQPRDLKRWLAFVEAQKWSETFVFFRHEETAVGPKFAGQFSRLIKNV
jgi:uncharacterized protein YecE (DUF72 family)